MVENPIVVLENWLRIGAQRIIVHFEAVPNYTGERAQELKSIWEICDKRGAVCVLATNPDTRVSALDPFLSIFNSYLVLSVTPGHPGQNFLPVVLDKIKYLRGKLPTGQIEIDGGINSTTAKLCKEAGADTLVSTSYIFDSPNPEIAYHELQST